MSKFEELLLRWYDEGINYLPRVLLAFVVFLLLIMVARSLRRWSFRLLSKMKKTEELAPLLSSIFFLFMLMLAGFVTLEILGLESVLAKLIAGAGIVGIIAGFAFKDIASNAFSGLILHSQRPFKVGDWVEIDGKFGTIFRIGWITTSIRTVLGQEVFIPNQIVYNDSFTNYSSFKKRRVVLKTGVSYGDDLDHVETVAIDEVQKIERRIPLEPIDFYFTEIGASSFNFELRFWIPFRQQTDFLLAQDEVIRRIKKRFEQENISIAYAVLSLDFDVKGGVNIFDKNIGIKQG